MSQDHLYELSYSLYTICATIQLLTHWIFGCAVARTGLGYQKADSSSPVNRDDY